VVGRRGGWEEGYSCGFVVVVVVFRDGRIEDCGEER